MNRKYIFLGCDLAALWMVQSAHLLHLFHYVPIIVQLYYEILRSYYQWEAMSMQKVKVTEVKTQLSF